MAELNYTLFDKNGKFVSGDDVNSLEIPDSWQGDLELIDDGTGLVLSRGAWKDYIEREIKRELERKDMGFAILSSNGHIDPNEYETEFEYYKYVGRPMMIVADSAKKAQNVRKAKKSQEADKKRPTWFW